MLPKSKDLLGYSHDELISICKKRNIDLDEFNDAFGINTYAIGKDGKPLYYECDVERALFILGHKDGKYHVWD